MPTNTCPTRRNTVIRPLLVLAVLLLPGVALANKQADEALMSAAQKGDVEAAKAALKAGANPNARDQFGDLPLARAARYRQDKIVELLLAAKANPKAGMGYGEKVIDHAKQCGDCEELIRAAIEKRPPKLSVNPFEPKPMTPDESLLSCLESGLPERALEHLKRGASPNAQIGDGLRPLMYAAGRGYYTLLAALLAKGAKLEATALGGRTALFYAARSNDRRSVDMLLAAGANVRATDNEGTTVAAFALLDELDDMVAYLVSKGAVAPPMPRYRVNRAAAAARPSSSSATPPAKSELEVLRSLPDAEVYARLPIDSFEAGGLAEIDLYNRQISNLGGLVGRQYEAGAVTGSDCAPNRTNCRYFRQGGGETGSSYVANASVSRDIRDIEAQRTHVEGQLHLHRLQRVREIKGK